ncbi:MAG TPA: caspase family protein [Pseudomonadales bacterium]|nr:caspase family protein [Pseudomonadales bacterium]
MFKPVRNLAVLISVGLLNLLQAEQAEAARYALLIGNDSYQEVPALRNARADAELMAQALKKAGYNTTVVKDRNLKQMKDDVRAFKAHVKGGDEVVFYYSGHGVQIDAMNYLLPVDVRADSEDQVRDDGLALSKVLDDIRQQKPALTLAVVDACRDNPFKGLGRAIGGRGLTGVGGANGQMVIYSAGEGQQALDSLSQSDPVKNGLFTRVFVKEMEKPGVPVDQVARRVRSEVNRLAQSVNHEQVPAIYDQVIGQFYFYAKNDADVDPVELEFWKSVRNSYDVGELKAYLEKYPNGQFTGLAQARIKSIEHSKAGGSKKTDRAPAVTEPAAAPAVVKEEKPAPKEEKPVAEEAKAAAAPEVKEVPAVNQEAVAAKVEPEVKAEPPKAEPAPAAPALEAKVEPAPAAVPVEEKPAPAPAAAVVSDTAPAAPVEPSAIPVSTSTTDTTAPAQ